MANAELSSLNPDAFSRFQLVCNEIKALFGKEQVKILDIGGASTYLFDFLSSNEINFELTILDIVDFEDKPKGVKVIIQSAEKLGFAGSSFDVVTGIDMLEHVPTKEMKQNIIDEATRVSQELIIFAGPCETAQVTSYEKDLNEQNKLLFNADQVWLAEHFKYGKPSKELLGKSFDSKNIKYRVFSALPLSEWYISSLTNLMPSVTDSASAKKLEKLNARYNKRFLNSNAHVQDNTPHQEGYRTFFVAAKNKQLSSVKPPKLAPGEIKIERYVDALVEIMNTTKNYASLSRDLEWFKKEQVRLKEENEKLLSENQAQAASIEQMAGGAVAKRARRIESYYTNKKGNK